MWERESKREKILAARNKELRLREKTEMLKKAVLKNGGAVASVYENIIRKETKGVDLIAKADRQFYNTIDNIKKERADLLSRFSSNL